MTRPPGPFERDSTDGPLRPLLWRLRARLVEPPAELRGRDDLDRIIVAAREQAHTTPSPGASARPGTSMDASTPMFPLHAALHGQAGDELARRRRRVLPQLGRIAAAVVVVIATASGMAGARDGAVTLNALLGREPRAPQQSASGELPEVDAVDAEDLSSDDTDSSAGGDDAEVPAHADAPDDGDGGEVEDEPAEPQPHADADQPASSEQPPSEVSNDEQDAGDGAGSEASTEPPSDGSSPKESPDAEQPAAPPEAEPEPQPERNADEQPEAPSGEAEVIAAPPPDDLDGFGGPVPRDCDSLTDCLPAGDDDAAADDDTPPQDDAPADDGSAEGEGGSADGDTPGDAADDDASHDDTADGDDDGDDDDGGLARRRYQPSNEPRSS